MPYPIKPVHKLDLHEEIFDSPSIEADLASISALQMQFFGNSGVREAKVKLSDRMIEMLRAIEQSQDEIVTAAQSLTTLNKTGDAIYRVPMSITDHDLLGLKTAELVRGHGRAVTLTEKGRIALRDHYLNQPVNEFRKARTKPKFDLNAAQAITASNESARVATASKFRRSNDVE
jgi:hypothetical protein